MKNSKQTLLMAAVLGLVVIGAGCTGSDEVAKKSTARAHMEAMKAAAEAEAAEEEFAKAKLAETKAAETKAADTKAAGTKSAETKAAPAKTAKTAKVEKRAVASVSKPVVKKAKIADPVFVVQVGTFKVEENAKNLASKLKSAGLPVFQKKVEREGGAVLYAVRIEPTPNRKEAEQFVASVKAATGEASMILSMER